MPLPVIAALAGLAGAAGVVELITYTSLLQARLPEAQISRVLSTVGLIGTTGVPLAYGFVGPLTTALGSGTVLLGCSAVALLAAAVAYAVPDVRQLGIEQETCAGSRVDLSV
jgi:NADH:ubiquinone oxidoreductase subunit 4 (subunit M)